MRISMHLLVVPLLLLAALSPLAYSAEPSALLGSPSFLPTPDQAVGWRGDGTGRYPGATPPKEWYIHLKNCPGLASSASKPKGTPAKLEAVPDIALDEWIGLGAWSTSDLKEGLETAHLADELTAEPSEGDKVGDKQWKKLPTQNGAVSLADVFGESPLDAGQHEWDQPKQGKVIYAVTYVYVPTDGEVSLVWTHLNGYRLYVNGQLLAKSESVGSGSEYGGTPHFNRFALKQGWSRLMLKSWGSKSGPIDHAWAFSAWLQKLPPKGANGYEYESKNIVYQAALPGGNVTSPIVVGDKLFVAGDHWLAALRKQDGQLLWYRTIMPYDGHAQETKGDAALIDQYNAMCKKVHDLDGQYPQQFKDGKVAAALASQYKQLADEQRGLLEKLDPKRAGPLFKTSFLQGEPGWTVTPCSDGKNVCVWNQMAVATCYDLDGKLQWSTTVEHGGGQEHGYSTSPVIVDGKFVCSQKNLWAFDMKTGAVAWSTDHHGSWGSLVRAKAGTEPVVVEPDGFIRGAKDGQLFRGDKGTAPKGANTCSPIPVEASQAVALSCGNGFDVADLGATVQHTLIPWPKLGLCGGLYADSPIASPVYHDGHAYMITMGGTLVTFDLKAKKVANIEHLDTRTIWAGTAVGGRAGITASPAMAGGLLHFFDDSGNTIVREPGPKGKVVARNSLVQGDANYLGRTNSIDSTPVFDASRIYWRAGNRLYCIGEK